MAGTGSLRRRGPADHRKGVWAARGAARVVQGELGRAGRDRSAGPGPSATQTRSRPILSHKGAASARFEQLLVPDARASVTRLPRLAVMANSKPSSVRCCWVPMLPVAFLWWGSLRSVAGRIKPNSPDPPARDVRFTLYRADRARSGHQHLVPTTWPYVSLMRLKKSGPASARSAAEMAASAPRSSASRCRNSAGC
jgi:hypothetical protein